MSTERSGRCPSCYSHAGLNHHLEEQEPMNRGAILLLYLELKVVRTRHNDGRIF
jgi:hypothetical protein